MSASEIKFDCPECSEGLAIDRRAIGHEVACPFCKDPITVPEIASPAEIPLELKFPTSGSGESPLQSLEELASSRPEVPADEAKGAPVGDELVSQEAEPSKGGLPARRKLGEKPKMLEGRPAEAKVTSQMPPANRGPAAAPPPPGGRNLGPAPTALAEPLAPRAGGQREVQGMSGVPGTEVPDGYEQKVRRKRKRRNPDEHRMNPREHPKMVAFEEAVGDNSFRKHPGHGKLPMWKKLIVIGSVLGILAAIGLGILKQKQLSAPDERTKPRALTPAEKEFETVKARLDAFCEANSVSEKMSYVRIPVTEIEGYPTLVERMNAFYSKNTLRPHFPTLEKASTTTVQQGETEFLRIGMEDGKGVESQIFFEKAVAGYALDWDSFVGYNPQNWTEFLVDPGEDSESGVFRLILEPADHYTGMFQDKEKYQSYMLTDVASASRAVGYAVKGTTAADGIEAAFEKLLMRDKKRILIIAKVALVERGLDGSYLVQIEKLLRNGWLLP